MVLDMVSQIEEIGLIGNQDAHALLGCTALLSISDPIDCYCCCCCVLEHLAHKTFTVGMLRAAVYVQPSTPRAPPNGDSFLIGPASERGAGHIVQFLDSCSGYVLCRGVHC